MARFRRTVRRPVRRVRARRRRLFRRRRRFPIRPADLLCKLTKISTVRVDVTKVNVYSLSFLPTDFKEFTDLRDSFEMVKFLKVRVRVLPLQNVANNTSSAMPAYCMLPWHRGGPAATEFNTYLSVDKAKVFRGTQTGRQSYVPCNLLANSTDTATAVSTDTINWRPTLYIQRSQTNFPRIYTGLIVFQGDGNLTSGNAVYNIIMDVWVVWKKQTTLPAT